MVVQTPKHPTPAIADVVGLGHATHNFVRRTPQLRSIVLCRGAVLVDAAV
jgi:hypothetical protein